MASTLHIAQHPEADRMLSTDPLALLLGMLLDQQFPMERAFAGPYVLAQRIGVTSLSAHALAAHDPETLTAAFALTPVVHRYPKAMAARTQDLCRVLVEKYDGSAAQLLMHALPLKKAKPEELAAIRRMIDEANPRGD